VGSSSSSSSRNGRVRHGLMMAAGTGCCLPTCRWCEAHLFGQSKQALLSQLTRQHMQTLHGTAQLCRLSGYPRPHLYNPGSVFVQMASTAV
jgi:hypothetical protein